MKRFILLVALFLIPATALAQPAAKPAPPDDVPADGEAGAPEEPPAEDPLPPAPESPVAPEPPPQPVVTPQVVPVESAPAVAPEPTADTATVVADGEPVSNKLTIGLKGGVNAGTQSGSGAADPSMHFGMCLGAFAVYALGPSLAVHGELLMTDKGADYVDSLGNDADEALLYVELPVFARYNMALGERLTAFGFGGPSVAYLIDSKFTMKGDLSPLDISVAAGVGVDISAGKRIIAVDLRFSQGLLNALDNGSDDTLRNRLVSLYAGVTL